MADYAAPAGPPPPKVPAGWLAKWNEQYSEWFYVNMYTRKSQWEKPTAPVYPPEPDTVDGAPPGPPPGYDPASAQPASDAKSGGAHLGSNNPYGPGGSFGSPSAAAAQPVQPAAPDTSEDEEFARQLQAEEDARGAQRADRGASASYYNQGQTPGAGTATTTGASYDDQPLPPRPEGKSKGLFGKLLGKSSKPPAHNQHQPYYGGPPPQPAYPGGGAPYPQPAQPYPGYGAPPPPGGYYSAQPAYGGAPYGRPGYGGYGGGYGAPPRRSGIGTGGAAALGAGGGLLGGLLLADAFDNEYQDGYNAGDDGGGGGGGDDGGGGDGGGGDGGGGGD